MGINKRKAKGPNPLSMKKSKLEVKKKRWKRSGKRKKWEIKEEAKQEEEKQEIGSVKTLDLNCN